MSLRASPLAVIGVAASLLGSAAPGRACGHCKEDKIAATYDHAVVTTARRNGHAIVYTELRGPVADLQLASWIRRQVETCPGVIRGTARVSSEPAALSFVYDPRKTDTARSLRAIEARLARRGLEVIVIETQKAIVPASARR
jgi:hypothetical protein